MIGTPTRSLPPTRPVAAAAVLADPDWQWTWSGRDAVRWPALPGGGALLRSTGAVPPAAGALGDAARVERATANLVADPRAAGAGGAGNGWAQEDGAWSRDSAYPFLHGTAFRVETGAGTAFLATDPIAVVSQGTYAYAYESGIDGAPPARDTSRVFTTPAGTTQVRFLFFRDAVQGLYARIDYDAGAGWQTFDQWQLGTLASYAHVTELQLEAQERVTSYCDGSLGAGYTWDGAAHGSTSTRAGGRVTVASAPLDPATGAVSCWLRPAWGSGDGAVHTVFDWRKDDGARMRLRHTAGGTWEFASAAGGAAAACALPASHAPGAPVALVAAWLPGVISLHTAAGSARAARAAVPGLRGAPLALGVHAAADDDHLEGVIGPVGWRTAAPRHPAALLRMTREPRIGDRA